MSVWKRCNTVNNSVGEGMVHQVGIRPANGVHKRQGMWEVGICSVTEASTLNNCENTVCWRWSTTASAIDNSYNNSSAVLSQPADKAARRVSFNAHVWLLRKSCVACMLCIFRLCTYISRLQTMPYIHHALRCTAIHGAHESPITQQTAHCPGGGGRRGFSSRLGLAQAIGS